MRRWFHEAYLKPVLFAGKPMSNAPIYPHTMQNIIKPQQQRVASHIIFHQHKVAQGCTCLSNKLLIGFYSPLPHGIINVTDIRFAAFKFNSKKRILMPIFRNRVIKADSLKNRGPHHKAKSNELFVRTLCTIEGCTFFIRTFFISIA